MLSRAAAPRIGPDVPAVQASGIATSWVLVGAVIRTEQPSHVHPRPKGPQLSSLALARPQPERRSFVHSLASFICGEPVRRGPIRSISSEAVSMTFELLNSSRRIFVTMSRSTDSVAGRAATAHTTRLAAAMKRFRGHLLCTKPRHGTTAREGGQMPAPARLRDVLLNSLRFPCRKGL